MHYIHFRYLIYSIILLSFILIISSCCQDKEKLFDGNYVKGTIVAVPIPDEYGFVEFGIDHDHSYLALFEHKYLKENYKLFDEVYFKVQSTHGIPLATDLTKEVKMNAKIQDKGLKTKINYHSFEGPDEESDFHRLGHIWDESESSRITPGVSDTLRIRIDNNIKSFAVSKSIMELAKSFGTGYVWFIETNSRIVNLDTCHYHGKRQIKCRRHITPD